MNIDDFLATGEVTLESGEEIAHALKGLVDSEGWKIYRSIVERQQTVRFDAIVLNPLQGMDQALEQEYRKGEIQGMRLAVTLPESLSEAINQQLRQLRKQREGEHE